MTHIIRIAMPCVLACLFSLQLSGQQDFFNSAIIVINGDPVLVTLDDLDEISDILLYLPDYFESNRTKEEYIELLRNTYVLGGLDFNQKLRFIEFHDKSTHLSPQGFRDVRHIANSFIGSEDELDVVVTASRDQHSKSRIDNIVHSLRAFGVTQENIKVQIRKQKETSVDGIVKIQIENELD